MSCGPALDAASLSREDMIDLPGGVFTMGSAGFYSEEAPPRRVRVDAFSIDRTPVTNRQFAAFVAATGHVTVAERPPDPREYPDLPPELACPASMVFEAPEDAVDLSHPPGWWQYRPNADWRHPLGPQSSLDGLDLHPVVHVAHADALAYCAWAGKRLPTEAEWEYAACGGRGDHAYAWGDTLAPGGAVLANYWHGIFPHRKAVSSWERTSPVGSFPPNAFGLLDMIGNVWEWTDDWWSLPQAGVRSARPDRPCCTSANPRGGSWRESLDPTLPSVAIGRKVIKGGSHLCAENYCRRYRPAARHPQMVDTSTSHIGFRCVESR